MRAAEQRTYLRGRHTDRHARVLRSGDLASVSLVLAPLPDEERDGRCQDDEQSDARRTPDCRSRAVRSGRARPASSAVRWRTGRGRSSNSWRTPSSSASCSGSRPRRPLPALPDSLAPDGATAPCPPPRLGPDARDVRPDVRRAVAVWGSKSWVHAAARYWWMSPPSRSWRSPASRDPPSPGCRRPTQRSPPRTTPTAQDELLCPATQSRHLPRQ